MPAPVFRRHLETDDDVLVARARARDLAGLLDLDPSTRARVAAAVAQLARAGEGTGAEIELGLLDRDGLRSLAVTVRDLDPAVLSGAEPETIELDALRRIADRLEVTPDGPVPAVRVHWELAAGADVPGVEEVRSALADRGPGPEAHRSELAALRRQNADVVAALADLRERERAVDALVTELQQQAQDLKASADAEQRALRSLAHELRTPLYAVRGLVEAVLADHELGDAVHRDLDLVHQAADEALAFVNDQLDLVRLRAGRARVHLRDTDLAELLTTLRVTAQHLPRADGVQLVVEEPGPDVPRVRTDGPKVSQVLRNLVSNALKATRAGRVVVRAEPDGPDHVRIAVTDTGRGLTPAELSRAFGEFAQVGEASPGGAMAGTGLGLPLARGIADVLGGELLATSDKGEGSEFALVLPLAHPGPRPDVEVVDET